jgi:predicted RND superfamily exporter protein
MFEEEDLAAKDKEAGSKKSTQESLTDKQNSDFVKTVQKVVDRYHSTEFPSYLAGSPVMTGLLKGEMTSNISRFTSVARGLMGLLLLLLFRSPVGVILPLITVIITLLSTVGLMAATDTPFTVITQIIP